MDLTLKEEHDINHSEHVLSSMKMVTGVLAYLLDTQLNILVVTNTVPMVRIKQAIRETYIL